MTRQEAFEEFLMTVEIAGNSLSVEQRDALRQSGLAFARVAAQEAIEHLAYSLGIRLEKAA